MPAQTITSTAEAINALGGTKAVSEMVGTSQQAVSNWRKQKRFPPSRVWIMRTELERRGFEAPLSLWGIQQQGRAA
jgi:YdaS antitoxin of YdaST toxin-antitoxin system